MPAVQTEIARLNGPSRFLFPTATPEPTLTPVPTTTVAETPCDRGEPGLVCSPGPDWVEYVNGRFRVGLRHPPAWTLDPRYDVASQPQYAGPDGFFQVQAAVGAGSPEATARAFASHKLEPYGSQPTIIRLQVAGRDARLVWPSDDQHPANKHVALLLVPYRTALDLQSGIYGYLLLWADAEHIIAIAKTIRILG